MAKKNINSLDRFRKRSPRLMLEQHAGCEVPAGCGGVVMRWRNPLEARPVRVHIYAAAAFHAWIDGEELTVGRLDLRPGRHVLAVEVGQADRAAGLLLAALRHDTDEGVRSDAPNLVAEPPFCAASAADGSWRFTLELPAEGWRSPEFDDAGWEALVARPVREPAGGDLNWYQWHSCAQAKAAGLGVPGGPKGTSPHGPVRVRKVFEVPTPSIS